MVKSKEGTSASTNIKEKKSLLDDEIGQDFLGSWNSMSVTQDDAMDFNFGTVLSGQKKTFNFGKLDMDFNLDADFNKFSSFKVDMPDLDFPSPSEKIAKAKPKERTEDSSAGNYKEEKDHFRFSFDFNDEDFTTDVQFGSNLVGSSMSLTRELANDKTVLLRSEENVKELSHIREDFNSDGVQNGSKVVSDFRPLDEQGMQGESDLLSSEKNPQEDLLDNDVPIGDQLGGNSKSSSTGISDSEPGSPISENNVKDFSDIREGFNPDGSQLEGDLRSLNKQVIQDEPAMLCSEKNSGEDLCANNVQIQNLSRDNSKSVSSDLTEGEPVLLRSDSSFKNSSKIREAFESDSEQNGSKLVSKIRLQDEQSANEESVMPGSEYNTREGFNTNDAHVGRKSVVLKSLSRELTKTEPVLEESRENGKSPSNIRKGMNNDGVQVGSKFGGNSKSQENETTIRKPIQLRSDKSSMKGMNIDSVQVGSKFGGNSKSQEKETATANPVQLSDKSSMEAFETDGEQIKPVGNIRPQDKQAAKDESVMPGSENNTGEAFETDGEQNKPVGNIRPQDKQAANDESVMPGSENNSGEGFHINDAQVGKKLVVSKSLPRKFKKTEPVLEENKTNDKNLSNIRKGINNNGIQVGSKFVGNSRSQEREAIIGKTVQLRSDKSSMFQVIPSSQTEKVAKSSTQASGNPKFMISSLASIQNLKNHSAEGHKVGKRTPELPSLKILRTTGANRNIPSPTVQRQNNSLRNLEQNTKLAENKTSKIAPPVDGIDKQKPLTTSLKRKISEDGDLVSLKPLKRLSESPKETRSLEESAGEVVEEETSNNENQAQSRTKNVLHNQPTPRLEVSEGVNRTELEIPLVMENNGNVEKAEAYTKELEDICNMLKKKHEEAKELLVRAIVNNNNLLMLNHPIYEEKIRMVQDFATLLTL